jgi:hypothetical protein
VQLPLLLVGKPGIELFLTPVEKIKMNIFSIVGGNHVADMETLGGFPCLPAMLRGRLSRPASHATRLVLLAAALGSACSVSGGGLDPVDASPTGGPASCLEGLTNQASWPAGTSYTSCIKPCGPDGIGLRTCSQTDKVTCQATSGCVCLDAPCVACADCAFQPPSECYVPTNASSAPACAEGVVRGSACSPACSRLLCLKADGKTGCVCNDEGKYACATWGGTTWK